MHRFLLIFFGLFIACAPPTGKSGSDASATDTAPPTGKSGSDASATDTAPPPHTLSATGNFAFPIGPASINGLDAGTYPNLTFPPTSQQSLPGDLVDQNSLLWGDVSQADWQGGCFSSAVPPALTLAAGIAPDGTQSAIWVNEAAATTPTLLLQHDAFVPAGVTSFNFEIDVMAPTGVTGVTVPMVIQSSLGGCGGGGIIAAGTGFTCVPTTSWTTCRLASGTVANGVPYSVSIPINSGLGGGSSGANFLIARARVVPTGTVTTPLFRSPESTPTGSFLRYEASPILQDNIRTEVVSFPTGFGAFRQYRFQSPFARMVFHSQGVTSIGVEVLNFGITNNLAFAQQVGINVNGLPWASVIGATSPPVEDAQVITLPSGNNTVELVGGVQSFNALGVYPEANNISGEFVRGVYSTSPLVIDQPSYPAKNILIWGDSKEAGCWSSNPTAQGFPVELRHMVQGNADVVVEAIGSRTLQEDTSSAGIQANLNALFATARPAILLSMIGRNDWAGSTMNAATYTSTLESAWDAIHAASPNTAIVAVTWWLESVGEESSLNSFSQTNAQYRTAELAACSARSTYCVAIDAAANIPNWNVSPGAGSSLYTDGVHLSNKGSGQAATYVADQIAALIPATSSSTVSFPSNGTFLAVQNATPGGPAVQVASTDNANNLTFGNLSNPGSTNVAGQSVTIGDVAGASLIVNGDVCEFTGDKIEFSNIASSNSPNIGQVTPIADTATQTLTIQSQGAFSGAATNINGGLLQVLGGLPAAGGLNGGILVGYGPPTGSTSIFGFGANGIGWAPNTASQSLASSPVTLNATQLLTPYVNYTGTLASNPTVVNLPNTAGLWFMDISQVVNTATDAIEFVSGSANCSTIPAALTVANDLVIVHTTGSNGITCGLL